MKRIFVFTVILTFIHIALFSEQITFQADSMSGSTNDKSSKTILEGDAKVTTNTMEISADSIELSGKEFRYIKASGNVTGKNIKTKMEFKCESMTYDRTTKIANLENNVSLDDKENDVKIESQIIQYDQDAEIAIMQIGVTIKQKNNVCTSVYAVYNKNEQTLNMNGNAQIVQGKDTFRAQNITLNLDTQEIILEGKVKGSVSSDNKNDENASAEKTEESAVEENSFESVSQGEESNSDDKNPDESNSNSVEENKTEGEDPNNSIETEKQTGKIKKTKGSKKNKK